MNAPLVLAEFLEWLRIETCRYPGRFPARADEWALEALEMLDNNYTAEYWKLVEDLENQCPSDLDCSDGPHKALKHIEGRLAILDDLEEILDREAAGRDKMQRMKKRDKQLEFLIAELDSAETENRIRASGAVIVAKTLDDGTTLEFDL